MSEEKLYLKYLKYKTKYFNLKKQSKLMVQNGGDANKVNDKTQIYLFKAEWCGHCRGFKPTWEKIKEDLKNKYEFITVDADKDKNLIEKWKIQGFPTIIKKVGDNAQEYIGDRDEQSVKTFIESN
jgi:thioredoxin 1